MADTVIETVLNVEKHAEDEPSGRRFLEWVVRHLGCPRGGCIQLVEETGVCERLRPSRKRRIAYSARGSACWPQRRGGPAGAGGPGQGIASALSEPSPSGMRGVYERQAGCAVPLTPPLSGEGGGS